MKQEKHVDPVLTCAAIRLELRNFNHDYNPDFWDFVSWKLARRGTFAPILGFVWFLVFDLEAHTEQTKQQTGWYCGLLWPKYFSVTWTPCVLCGNETLISGHVWKSSWSTAVTGR